MAGGSWGKNKFKNYYVSLKNYLQLCTSKKIINMLRAQKHIETVNRFSPMGDYPGCGACYLHTIS